MSAWLHSLNTLDWTLAVVVATSAIFGFLRGLIRCLASLAGIIVGVLLAGWYSGRLGLRLAHWVTPQTFAYLLAFALIVIATIVVFAIAGRLMRGAAGAIGLGFLDRCGGAFFGAIRGILLIAAALLPIAASLPAIPPAKNSVLLPCFLRASHGVSFVLPRDFKVRISNSLQHLTHADSTIER